MGDRAAAPAVQLVVTPFLPREQPALGASSLAAVLAQRGVEAKVVYLNLAFLRTCPPPLYDIIAHSFSPTLLGEVIFARALWGSAAPPWRQYFETLQHSREDRQRGVHASFSLFADGESEARFWREAPDLIAPIHERAPEVVASWAEQILSSGPTVVGFSTTFQQNVASLALARELRRQAGSSVTLLFGGANCEGEMGRAIARNFPFADHVVSGEGERAVADFVPALAGLEDAVTAAAPTPRVIVGEPVQDLDGLPLPDFEDYVETHRRGGFGWPFQLAAETSRGCWWGAKSHCKFCGLNGSSMSYRSKSPQRAVDEILELSERYATRRLMMADNILDTRYLSTVMTQLRGSGLDLFYEIKVNLTKADLTTMRAAGVSWIQPGLESLSSHTLELMGKGAKAIQNIQLLRWCAELDVRVAWNILYGFPDEDVDEFARTARLTERLAHLSPPNTILPFRMDRFSPYFDHAESHGLVNVRPYWSYRYAYPGLTEEELAGIAYFFEFDYECGRDPRRQAHVLVEACAAWDRAHRAGASLRVLGDANQACIYDTRSGTAEVVVLGEPEMRLLAATDSATDAARLLAGQPDLERVLERFRRRGWVYEEGGRVVRLVVIPQAGNRLCQ